MSQKLLNITKDVVTGRKTKFIDDLIFKISNERLNGWLIGNKIRNSLAGKRKYVSNMPLIFVVGCPRSGTTLLQTLSKIFKGVGGPEEEVCLFQDLSNSDLMKKAFEIEEKDLKNLIRRSKGDIILASEKLLKRYGKKNGLGLVILKAPKNVLFIEDLFRYFPNSKVINIVRDGRDVAVSIQNYFLKQTGKKFLFEYGVKTWVVSINQGKKHRKNKKYIEIKYEDLVNDPYKSLVSLSKFLKVKSPTKKRVSDFHKHLNPKKVISTHRSQLLKPIYKSSIGNYKKKMNEKQKKAFKKIANKTLVELKYEKDGNW